jgi:hypothetical protein
MTRFFNSLLLSLLLVACSQSGSIPANVLPPAQMQNVLWDMMLADETADYYIQKDSSINALAKHAEWYQPVFQIHKISKEDFKRSLRFYESRPDLLKPIFDSLQKRAEQQPAPYLPHRKVSPAEK